MTAKVKAGVLEPDVDFQWPKFKSERDRIKNYSLQFKNTSIEDAFKEVYGVQISLNKQLAESINLVPKSVKVNDVIEIDIIGVSPDNITLDTHNIKEDVVCKNNLFKYDRFKNITEPITVSAKVVKVDKKQVIVDVIEPLYEKWIQQITTNPLYQYNINHSEAVLVKDLRLVNGGYIAKVEVPAVQELTGEKYFVDAFIPGSQIVLNIENDFKKWEGKSVWAFVTNFMQNPLNPSKVVAVCSVKKLLQHTGNVNMINIFKQYTEDTDWWKDYSKKILDGIVTGIINSSKKCGVFVEVPDLSITGMIQMKPQDIVKYSPGSHIAVNLIGFDIPTYYNDAVNQIQHIEPYTFNKDNNQLLERCNLKPIFNLA